MDYQADKVFVVSLPRTGTTSFSALLLELGFKVAHTAFTQAAFDQADAVSDAPVFADYRELDGLFPNARFIYLEREFEPWRASITALLHKLAPKIADTESGISPVLTRSYCEVFAWQGKQFNTAEQALHQAYSKHRQEVFDHFAKRDDFFCFKIDAPDEMSDQYQALANFLAIDWPLAAGLPMLNQHGRINAWQQIKHPGKVDCFAFGEQRRRYFDFKQPL